MVRKVFFSFHYGRDAWRAGQVRNSNVIKSNSIATSDFIDSAKWEEVKRNGDAAIKKWIQTQLDGTSVTVVLIGAETSKRRWVDYEIKESYRKKNGMIGLRIHNIRDHDGRVDAAGKNPFDGLTINRAGKQILLSQIYSTYDWVGDNGRANLGSWIEKAAKDADR